MKRFALSTLLLAAAAAPAPAQVCGPLTFVFGATGAGCAPFGGGVPTLTAALTASPSIASCPVAFTLTPAPSPTPIGILTPVFLILGASNPVLDLTPAGLPGCTLLAFPDVIVPMSPNPGVIGYGLTVPVPASPALIGGTAYGQGVMLGPIATTTFAPRLSNGVSISIL